MTWKERWLIAGTFLLVGLVAGMLLPGSQSDNAMAQMGPGGGGQDQQGGGLGGGGFGGGGQQGGVGQGGFGQGGGQGGFGQGMGGPPQSLPVTTLIAHGNYLYFSVWPWILKIDPATLDIQKKIFIELGAAPNPK